MRRVICKKLIALNATDKEEPQRKYQTIRIQLGFEFVVDIFSYMG